MTDKPTPTRVEREARLRWVPIPKMRVSPLAQRDLNKARVDRLAADFDLEQIGTPTANERGDCFYIIDGQHRIEALKELGWGDQQIQCWTYVGLSEEEEAEKFLKLNDTLTVHAFAKFKVGVQAGRVEETDIDRIVRALGLRVSQEDGEGAIGAVGALRRVYHYGCLARTLTLIRDSFGDAGLQAIVINGIGLLCSRYDGVVDIEEAAKRLNGTHGGVSGLLGRAEILREKTGSPKTHCVAAAAVDIINSGRGGKKLPNWWKSADESQVAVAS